MAKSLILLFVVGLAAAQTATIKHELNTLDTKDDRRRIEFQSTLPSVMTSTTSNSYHNGAKLRIQEDKVKKSIIQDKISEISSPAFFSQDISARSQNTGMSTKRNLFQSERLPSISDFPLSQEQQQDFRQQAQFYGQDQDSELQSLIDGHEQRKFYDDKQEPIDQMQYFGDQQPEHEQRNIFGRRQNVPQQYYNEAKEQQAVFSDIRSRQNQMQFSENRNPSSHQQQVYSNIQMGIDDRIVSTDKSFQTVSNIQNQVYSGKQLMATQTGGFQGHVRPAIFDSSARSLVQPQRTAMRSSVFVSGENNLPLVPAMVYNVGSLPSSHAVAVGKGTAFRGSVRHHLHTPYVRYVYSHLL